jgi:hypothetical protein
MQTDNSPQVSTSSASQCESWWHRYQTPTLLALVTAFCCFVGYEPAHLYFFGDTWDLFYDFVDKGWRAVLLPHNEHIVFIPDILLYIQYQLFGMNNLPYQFVDIFIHTANTILVYVLAGYMTSRTSARVFGALFFGLGGVYWEVTMWEAEQQTTIAVFFMLFSLFWFHRNFQSSDWKHLAYAALSVVGSCLSFSYGVLCFPLLVVYAISFHWQDWRRSLRAALLTSGAALAGYLLMLFACFSKVQDHPGHLANLAQFASLPAWVVKGTWEGLLLPLRPLSFGPLLLIVVFALAAGRAWTKRRLAFLILPIFVLLGSSLLTGLGRVGYGLDYSLASRYQYVPMIGLALIAVVAADAAFCAAGRWFKVVDFLFVLAIAGVLPVYAVSSWTFIHEHSPRIDWGIRARRFVERVVNANGIATSAPASTQCVKAEFSIPTSMYPGNFPLRMALRMYRGTFLTGPGACSVSLEDALKRPGIRAADLLRGRMPGGDSWKLYTATQVTTAGTTDAEGVTTIRIPGSGAYSLNLIDSPNEDHPYTFASWVRLNSGSSSVCLRLTFKDAKGEFLDVARSVFFSGSEFRLYSITGLAPAGTAQISVDYSNEDVAVPAVLAVKEAFAASYPLYVSDGNQ